MKHQTLGGAAARSAAEHSWHIMVEVVMATRGNWRRKVAAATGLPFSRVRALWRLEDAPLTMSELAHELATDAPATSVLINALEDRGLVKRRPHPTDGRVKLVSLTAAGRRMLAVVASIGDEPPQALTQLTMRELEQLRATLTKLV